MEAKRTIYDAKLIGLGCGFVKNPAHAPGTGPLDLHICELSPMVRRALKEDQFVRARAAFPAAFMFVFDKNFLDLTSEVSINFRRNAGLEFFQRSEATILLLLRHVIDHLPTRYGLWPG